MQGRVAQKSIIDNKYIYNLYHDCQTITASCLYSLYKPNLTEEKENGGFKIIL